MKIFSEVFRMDLVYWSEISLSISTVKLLFFISVNRAKNNNSSGLSLNVQPSYVNHV